MLVRVVCTGCLAQWDLTECCFSWQRRRIKKHITGTTRTQTHTGSKHLVLACLTTTASQTLGRASGASNQTGAQTKTPSSFLDTGTAIRDLQPRCRFDDSHRCPSCRIAVVSAGLLLGLCVRGLLAKDEKHLACNRVYRICHKSIFLPPCLRALLVSFNFRRQSRSPEAPRVRSASISTRAPTWASDRVQFAACVALSKD